MVLPILDIFSIFQHIHIFHVLLSDQSPINYKRTEVVLNNFSAALSSRNVKVLFSKLVKMASEEPEEIKQGTVK